ncbi:MAG: PilT protein-like protein [bacterium]|nr:MAG: PilT protein-like protein [bacterium]
MRLLLDTHIFLWWDSDPSKLSKMSLEAIEDKSNSLFLSIISIWEIQVKKDIGKLSLRVPLIEMLEEQEKTNEIKLLPLETKHIFGLEGLTQHHKDPFDRVIIAQAKVENLTVITNDIVSSNYGVKLLS